MNKLYCRLLDTDAARHQVTRRGHRQVSSSLETWEGKICTVLRDTGDFEVWLGPKDGPGKLIHKGNVNR